MVLVGWAIGKPFLLDNVEPFAALVLTLSVIHTYFVSSDGNSNWYFAFLPRRTDLQVYVQPKQVTMLELTLQWKIVLNDQHAHFSCRQP